MSEKLYEAATVRKSSGNYSAFSDYIQALIRADQEQGILGPRQQQWQKAG